VAAAETARRYITSEMLFHAKHTGVLRRRVIWIARTLRALRGWAYYGLLRGLVRRDAEDKYARYRAWLGVLARRAGRRATPGSEKSP
jgi:hypothetical protein